MNPKQIPCNKVFFATEKDALYYINKLNKTSTRSYKPSRPYLCEKCNTWHLTSTITVDYAMENKVKSLKEKNEKLVSDLNNSKNEIVKDIHKEDIYKDINRKLKEQIARNDDLKKWLSETIGKLSTANAKIESLQLEIQQIKKPWYNKLFK